MVELIDVPQDAPQDALPNVRSLWLPDPGFVLVEADLARADAQVVAWDADCPSLKRIFQAGIDIHSDNARFLYGCANPRDYIRPGTTYRDYAKNVVHATDYGANENTLSNMYEVEAARAAQFIRKWKQIDHPEINAWHQRIEWELTTRKSPTMRNAFGFRRMYAGGPASRTGGLLGQALAWIAQSTVSVAINKAMLRVYQALPDSDVQLLMQIHDSLLMQVRAELCPDIFPVILDLMRIEIPYPDPLVIPLELKWSASNWGHMEKWNG